MWVDRGKILWINYIRDCAGSLYKAPVLYNLCPDILASISNIIAITQCSEGSSPLKAIHNLQERIQTSPSA